MIYRFMYLPIIIIIIMVLCAVLLSVQSSRLPIYTTNVTMCRLAHAQAAMEANAAAVAQAQAVLQAQTTAIAMVNANVV